VVSPMTAGPDWCVHVHPQLYIVGFLVLFADISTSTLNFTSLGFSYSMLTYPRPPSTLHRWISRTLC
ncbi:hypothetical protein PoB_005129100, partial [Plakobranchus ocellatus]